MMSRHPFVPFCWFFEVCAMQYLPVFLDLNQRAVLVVGGTEKATQKLRILTRTRATISVVAEQVTAEIAELVKSGAVKHIARAFRSADIVGHTVVFAANDDEVRDTAVAAAANAAGVLVNVVDGPAQSGFVLPAATKSIQRGAVIDEFATYRAARDGSAAASSIGRPGVVSLIGCGPGEPDLLTLKAQQRLQEADVLVIDRLVNPAILDYARHSARRIDVGKNPNGTSFPQEEINRILVREALLGNNVARLKGGDAFVFGRAAEEMAAVRAAGATVEIIPGITAAHACAASVGLPLTQRGDIREFTVLTGATRDGVLDFDWAALARPGHAFAIYMGVGSSSTFAEKLLAAGADDQTPVVIVENGTRTNERSVATNLGLLARAVQETGITGPAIIFVGLSWDAAYLTRPAKVEVFDGKPKFEVKAVVTKTIDEVWTPQEIALATFWVAG
jgi:uroporphyrin-III C-methyltransferase / precorrin-2 dehydrogenase / sirohydrochlorin ferrochelatase